MKKPRNSGVFSAWFHFVPVNMERAKGIEPSYSAWEADVLPLNYARINLECSNIIPPEEEKVNAVKEKTSRQMGSTSCDK